MGIIEGTMKMTIAMKTPNINYFDTRLLDESQQLYLFIYYKKIRINTKIQQINYTICVGRNANYM